MKPPLEPAAAQRIGKRRRKLSHLGGMDDRTAHVAGSPSLEGPLQFDGCGLFADLLALSLGSASFCTPGPGAPRHAQEGRHEPRREARHHPLSDKHATKASSRRQRADRRGTASEKPLQIRCQGGGRRIPIGGLLGEACRRDGSEVTRYSGDDSVGRHGLVEHDAAVDLDVGAAVVGALAGEEPVEQKPESVDVGGGPDGPERAVDLLGGHPGWRAQP